jgi:hypothetical protein
MGDTPRRQGRRLPSRRRLPCAGRHRSRSPPVGDVDELPPLVGDAAATTPSQARRRPRRRLRRRADMGAAAPGNPRRWGRARSGTPCDPRRSATTSRRHATPCRTRALRGCTTTICSSSPWPPTSPTGCGCLDRSRDRSRGRRLYCRRVAAGPAPVRDYYETVTRAVGVPPVWDDAEAWTGRLLADRAHSWGWIPAVELAEALRRGRQGSRIDERSGRGPESADRNSRRPKLVTRVAARQDDDLVRSTQIRLGRASAGMGVGSRVGESRTGQAPAVTTKGR